MEIIEYLLIIIFLLGFLLWSLNRLTQKGKKKKRTVSRWDASRRTAESYSDKDNSVKNYWSIRGGTTKKIFGKVIQHSKEETSWHNTDHKYK